MIPSSELINSNIAAQNSNPGALLSSFRDFDDSTNTTRADRPSGTKHERWLNESIEYLNNLSRLGLERIPINYNGTDCQLEIKMGGRTFNLSTPISISCSVFRQKTPARKLGLSTAAGYAKGTRTIAGSMVMTCGVNHPLLGMMIGESWDISTIAQTFVLPDMIPPFSMALHFDSELWSGRENDKSGLVSPSDYYIGGSVMEILGVELLSDSTVVSCDDMLTEVVMNFVAAAYTPLRSRQVGYNLPTLLEFKDDTVPQLYLLQEAEKERQKRLANRFPVEGMSEPLPQELPTEGVGDIPVTGGEGEELDSDPATWFPNLGSGDDGNRSYHSPQIFN